MAETKRYSAELKREAIEMVQQLVGLGSTDGRRWTKRPTCSSSGRALGRAARTGSSRGRSGAVCAWASSSAYRIATSTGPPGC